MRHTITYRLPADLHPAEPVAAICYLSRWHQSEWPQRNGAWLDHVATVEIYDMAIASWLTYRCQLSETLSSSSPSSTARSQNRRPLAQHDSVRDWRNRDAVTALAYKSAANTTAHTWLTGATSTAASPRWFMKVGFASAPTAGPPPGEFPSSATPVASRP
jgi:hypothetical protein